MAMNDSAKRFLISKARLAWRYYDQARKDCLKGTKCVACLKKVVGKDRRADHIDPVVDPAKGFIDWNTFLTRLFCEHSGLQLLHIECHDKKTKQENKARRKSA